MEKEYRKQAETLSDAGEKLAVCQSKMEEIRMMMEDHKGLLGIYQEVKNITRSQKISNGNMWM